nr:phosphatase PAP2 family protein [uncultured Sellimonas sp.]
MNFLWFLEGIRTPIGNEFFQFVTYLGQELFLLGIICIFYWCINKKFAYQLGLTYFSAGLCIQTLKITFRIPRPWILDSQFHAVESAVPGATGYSFPSGHTQGGTCLFAPLALRTKRTVLKFLCVFAFLLIGFSRMYLGVHTPKDVLVSMAISLLFSLIFWKYTDKLLDNKRNTLLLSVCLGIVSLLVFLYAFIQMNYGGLPVKYASDCCKAAGAGFGFAIGFYIERTYIDFSEKTSRLSGQFLKVLIGLAGAGLLKFLLSFLSDSSIILKSIEYCILVLWILVVYPMIFSRFQRKNH